MTYLVIFLMPKIIRVTKLILNMSTQLNDFKQSSGTSSVYVQVDFFDENFIENMRKLVKDFLAIVTIIIAIILRCWI